jgi:hypothetical protein
MLTRLRGEDRADAPISRRTASLAGRLRRDGPEARGHCHPIDLRSSAYGLHPTDSQHCSRRTRPRSGQAGGVGRREGEER